MDKGDVLLGKTFTVDPILKRKLANMEEENQYYIRDHHEAIVSREIWDKAEEIRLKRAKPKLMQTTGNRERYTRQFTFSSMLECGYCGHKLSRRTRHQITTRVKQLEKDISIIESKKSRLTDLLIDGKIEQEDYDEKKLSFQRKLHQITEGNPTPYKLTFVLKCNQTLKVENAKADYRANQKGKKVS